MSLPQLITSVVVPTYNRSASLARLLDALALQTYPAAQFEVIVVDDGSSDGTLEFVQRYEAPYRLRLVQQAHAGPAEARNRGVQAAHGQLIVFLDDDVAPVETAIQEHVDAHSGNPRVVVIGPMLPPGEWPRSVWVRWEEDKLLRQYQAMVDGKWACTARQFYTGNASVDRALFVEAGGFDSGFARAEDVELAYRLRALGARFQFNPHARVLHYAWRSFESWCRTPYQYGRYDVIMQRDKGQQTLDDATQEFHHRKALNRVVVRLCVGRQYLAIGMVKALATTAQLAGHIGAHGPAKQALSAIFNLLYWQGVCDEVGDRRQVFRAIAARSPS